jgi:phenylalanyl-tRNA synthetase beta chain
MKVSLNWLRDYVDIEIPADELARILTMTGLEVEEIEQAGQALDDIVVARLTDVEPHPESDRLSLCRVDTGKDPAQVVCGAPNLDVGSLYPFARPGARLPDGTVIKETRLRGEASKGMLLAEDELGLSEDHTGLMKLPPELEPGTSLPLALPLSDWILEIGITPNRPDCACILGVAREIAAVTGQRIRRPDMEVEESGPPIGNLTSVTLLDSEGCPRYVAGLVRDVALGASPFWMRHRLYLCGIRSISNIVDVTNYVMLEMGQPLHAFDYNRLRENRIVVRKAREGEKFTTLDGETRTLSSEILLICDGERPVAVAGIMGGLNSEIFANTKDVLVESAFFDPVTIRRGSKYLGLSTEASYRFERGADIEGATAALRRSISLISQLAGGEVAAGFIDNYPKAHMVPTVDLNVDKTNRLLGTNLSRREISTYLKALEMDVQETGDNDLSVRPPSFRVDVLRGIDLMEEVARLSGFENIPVTSPTVRSSEEVESPELILCERVRSIMTGLGFTEVITYAFISPESADILGAGDKDDLRSFVRLLNPLTIDQSVMRTSLVPGLLGAVKTNIQHDEKDLKIFEWGKVFIWKGEDQLPLEKTFLAGVMTGRYNEKTWYDNERPVDFYDIKGAVEGLLRGLGLKTALFQRGNDLPRYDANLSSNILCEGSPIGHVGQISKRVMSGYDLGREEAYLFELDIKAVLENLMKDRGVFSPLAKYPAVYRDISLIVDRQTETGKILELIGQEGGVLVESVRVFDVYEGDKIDPLEKALAFTICYRSEHETLDGKRINQVHDSIVDRIRKETGGRLREG